MKNKYINKPSYKHILIVVIAIIYLYASYELKVVRGYNSGYKSVGMDTDQVIFGAILVILFISKDLYDKYKLKRLIKKQLRKHQKK